ncbi:MAG: neuraminidase-like domain-containing protein, partial [Bacteroidia bacterium]
MNWTFEELDWAMRTNQITDLNEAALLKLAKIKYIQEQLNTSVFTCTALFNDLKISGFGNGNESESQYDKIFNTPIRIQSRPASIGMYRPDKTLYPSAFDHPLFVGAIASADQKTAILKCLNASSKDLAAIAKFFKNNTLEDIQLTVPNLSLFYRHVTLAKLLDLSINDYLQLAAAFNKQSQYQFTIDDVLSLIDAAAWMNEWNINVYELSYILSGPNKHVNPNFDADQTNKLLQNWAAILNPFLVTGSVLGKQTLAQATIPDLITELKASGALPEPPVSATNQPTDIEFSVVALKDVPNLLTQKGFKDQAKLMALLQEKTASDLFTNAVLQKLVDESYLNASGIVINPIPDADQEWKIVELDIPLIQNNIKYDFQFEIHLSVDHSQQIKKRINEHYAEQQNKLVAFLATSYNTNEELIRPILEAAQGLKQLTTDLVSTLSGSLNATKQGLLNELSKWIFITQKFDFSKTGLRYILHSRNSMGFVNNQSSWQTVDWTGLKNIAKAKAVLVGFTDDQEVIATNLLASLQTENLSADFLKILRWSEVEFNTLKTELYGDTGFKAYGPQIFQVKNCFDLSKKNKLNVVDLKKLSDFLILNATEANWTQVELTAAALVNAVSLQTTEDRWPELYKKLHGKVLEHQRQALIGKALCLLGGEYNDVRKLSEFLLLDVSMNSDTEISLVKLGLNSAQLYLQRCR